MRSKILLVQLVLVVSWSILLFDILAGRLLRSSQLRLLPSGPLTQQLMSRFVRRQMANIILNLSAMEQVALSLLGMTGAVATVTSMPGMFLCIDKEN